MCRHLITFCTENKILNASHVSNHHTHTLTHISLLFKNTRTQTQTHTRFSHQKILGHILR